ncbi:MAG: Clp protease ClpP [Phycisphaeraceae bacterium]|nr:Clp protease ClpP [Phycisphaeraceae bacterium]
MPKILNADAAEILIYGVIGDGYYYGEVSAKGVREALDALGSRDVTVRIHSPGGSVDEAMAIYTLLSERNVHVTIDGAAYSSASFIAMAGKTIRMSGSAMMMVHEPWTVAVGDAKAFRKMADVLDTFNEVLVKTYADRTGRTPEEISDLLAAETWLKPEKALELGFVDEVIENRKVENHYDLSRFKNAPKDWPKDAATPRLDAAKRRQAALQV